MARYKTYTDDKLIFTPEDTSSMITIGDLTLYLVDLITDIRAHANGKYKKLVKEIKKLKSYEDEREEFEKASKDKVELFFNAYHQIITISLELRHLLSDVLDLGDYDSIKYAVYYNGRRYKLDELKPEWMRVSSKNGLMLNLSKATKGLKKEMADKYAGSVQEIFDNHYKSYLKMIKETYRGEKTLGEKGSRITLGHVAEAYEEHLGEDHPAAYKVLNSSVDEIIKYSSSVKAMTALRAIGDEKAQWPPHESVDSGWMHIKHSLGTQRGTVAGDVGQFQVKQAKDSSNATIRLARFSTLLDGIEIYSKILGNGKTNADIPKVAYDLAQYLSEPVSEAAANTLNFTGGKEINNDIKALEKVLDKKLNSVIHL